MLQCVAECCSVLYCWCVTVCCSVCCGVLRCAAVQAHLALNACAPGNISLHIDVFVCCSVCVAACVLQRVSRTYLALNACAPRDMDLIFCHLYREVDCNQTCVRGGCEGCIHWGGSRENTIVEREYAMVGVRAIVVYGWQLGGVKRIGGDGRAGKKG